MGDDGMTEFNHARERRSLKHRYQEMDEEVKPLAQAAYMNEGYTRERVKRLEDAVYRPFWGRLKWLLLGK
jgi:hypothetical protein